MDGGELPGTGVAPLRFNYSAEKTGATITGTCKVSTLLGPATEIKCLDVTGYHQDGRTLLLTGPATVNGERTTFRITVRDRAGAQPDEFLISTGTGFNGGGALEQGKLSIRH